MLTQRKKKIKKSNILFSFAAHLVKLGSHGVMYSKHKCFNSIVEERKPWIHSSRNSSVRWDAFCASFSLICLMNIVLFDGMHKPVK